MIEEKRIIPLKFDLMFKKVFGDKNDQKPLRKLLECILGINPKQITILNPEIIGSSYYDKRTIVDLIVELDDGTQIGIEMNTNVNKYLIARNLRYLFKNIGQGLKKGSSYGNLQKYIQINIDCEGKHIKPIETYKIMEIEKHKILTEDVEIVRVDLSYYVKRCYNEDASKLDYKDKFIGLMGIEDRDLAKNITKGDASMEEILKKVEDFSEEECETLLFDLILQTKSEIEALRSGENTDYPDNISSKKKRLADYMRENPNATNKSDIARQLNMDRTTVRRYYDEIRAELAETAAQ